MKAKLRRALLLICAISVLACTANGEAASAADPPSRRIDELRAQIAHHDELYFKQAEPEISDFDYDALKAELAALERAHPELRRKSTGASDDRSGRFPTYRHRSPMLSLDKTYAEADLRGFCERVERSLGHGLVDFVIEPKVDGLAISVVYERGRLTHAVTRGNGQEGDDITQNIVTIEDLPQTLVTNSETVPELIELRGEVYLSFEAFDRLNREREASGEPLFANPRNAASGTAKLTDSRAVAGRGLRVVFYGVGTCEPELLRPPSQQALLAQFRSWGLPTFERVDVAQGAEATWHAVAVLGERRAALEFPTDGAVVKVDRVIERVELGEGTEAPRGAMAFKYAPLRAETRVRGITLQVGRTGVITPVAELEPVEISGSTVTRASLHNRNVIRRLDVRVDDSVWVEKSGEIIPEVVAVNIARRSAASHGFAFPDKCPACGTFLAVDDDAVRVLCPNENCPAQVRRRLEHFGSAAALDIEGLGPATVDALVSRGWVRQPADLYRLKRDQLVAITGAGDVSADALLAAIERSRSRELWRVLVGLSIPRVGESTARGLATVYGDLATFSGLQAADFAAGGRAEALGLNRATIDPVVAWFSDDGHRAVVRGLDRVGLRPKASPVQTGIRRAAVAGRIFVLTGRLAHFSRDEATTRIQAAGGRVSSSVSRRTDFVVAGDDPGEKLDRAHELGVRVIDETELERMLTAP